MIISSRQQNILHMLKEQPDIPVRELAARLYVSEPTIRRDFNELAAKGLIRKHYGGAELNSGDADRAIPFILREQEKSSEKVRMGRQAAEYVRDGMTLFLDGSTSAYHIVPYLSEFSDLTVVTSGAKTAVALAERQIRTFCTGGQMILPSFSYVGEQATEFVERINADLLFFSCRGLSDDGKMTDISIGEADLRRAMFRHSRTKILLCDSSKIGKTYFYTMGTLKTVDVLITGAENVPVWEQICRSRASDLP